MPPERLVVIGGDAAGMSAASQVRKRRGADSLQVVAFERGHATSYSACGIPYWISGTVGSAKELIARSPEQHRANGNDVRTYAPPFAPVWDPVLIAARKAFEAVEADLTP
jgi:NADPH-dependent 2,4-dienoyl-CoA reductase/sulfur reductase-like enzyme